MNASQPAPDGRVWPSTQIALLEGARDAQNHDARRSIFEIYGPLIRRYVRKRGAQAADAEDIVQNVFCRLEQALPRFTYDQTRGRFRGWLGTITYREMRRYQLRAGGAGFGVDCLAISVEELGDELVEAAEPEWVDAFNAHVLQVAMQRVCPEFDRDTWQTFVLVWLHDVPPHQVAVQMAKRPSWIYKAKFRVLQRLKEEVLYLADDTPWLQR